MSPGQESAAAASRSISAWTRSSPGASANALRIASNARPASPARRSEMSATSRSTASRAASVARRGADGPSARADPASRRRRAARARRTADGGRAVRALVREQPAARPGRPRCADRPRAPSRRCPPKARARRAPRGARRRAGEAARRARRLLGALDAALEHRGQLRPPRASGAGAPRARAPRLRPRRSRARSPRHDSIASSGRCSTSPRSLARRTRSARRLSTFVEARARRSSTCASRSLSPTRSSRSTSPSSASASRSSALTRVSQSAIARACCPSCVARRAARPSALALRAEFALDVRDALGDVEPLLDPSRRLEQRLELARGREDRRLRGRLRPTRIDEKSAMPPAASPTRSARMPAACMTSAILQRSLVRRGGRRREQIGEAVEPARALREIAGASRAGPRRPARRPRRARSARARSGGRRASRRAPRPGGDGERAPWPTAPSRAR